MHNSDATSILAMLKMYPSLGRTVHFVSPIVSTLLAASTNNRELNISDRITFAGQCSGYAENCGLVAALANQYTFPRRSGRQGLSYTKLTRLSTHDEVDMCNSVVSDLIFEHFEKFGPFPHQLAKVVGELHDNVASHANGSGFSCAQVYNDGNAIRVEFAIADSGCGMLRNVRQILPEVASHTNAIEWCLKRGHTTARNNEPDPWAQRLPDDAIGSPYSASTPTRRTEDHHIGEGLWKLSELARNMSGRLWIASGDGEVLIESEKKTAGTCRINWPGVAIELELVIATDYQPTPEQQVGIEIIAGRIGLDE